MRKYANTSNVSVERSKTGIEKILRKYGASHFSYATDHKKAIVGFVLQNRMIKLSIVLPDIEEFATTPSGRRSRSQEGMLAAWEQACRSSWRALHLVIHAKLEAVESGIASFENEFLAYTVLPNKKTVAEEMTPQINQIIESGKMSKLLLPAGDF